MHTHTAPITGYRPEERINDTRLKPLEVQEQLVCEALTQTVDEAVSSMGLAKMGYARGKSYINVNRNQDYGRVNENGQIHVECGLGVNSQMPVDRTLFVLKLEGLWWDYLGNQRRAGLARQFCAGGGFFGSGLG